MREPREVLRRRAILRGLEFVYQTASDPQSFEEYGFDYLSCLTTIFSTAKDSHLRARAFEMSQDLAIKWRRAHPILPSEIDADTLTEFVFATSAADEIGLRDEALKLQIRREARNFNAEDYFWFDPTVEAPPNDIPESCTCGANNSRGRTTCSKCRRRLKLMSRYEVWLVALIRSYMGERYGVILGASYFDVMKWLPVMRPYSGPASNDNDIAWAVYAVTHVVYTLNGYGVYKLSPSWLPDEFEFLKTQVQPSIESDDPETVGEILDSLKSFGLDARCRLIQKAEQFILAKQNSDGSWGEAQADDIYERYHPTIAAIDGLRSNAWHGLGLSFPDVKPLLSSMVPVQRPSVRNRIA